MRTTKVKTSESAPMKEVKVVKQSDFLTRFLDGGITFCLAVIFFGLPLFFTGWTFQGLFFEKQIFFYFWILLALVFWVVRSVITGEMGIKKTPLDVPLAIFWLVYLVATIFSFNRWYSFWGFSEDLSRSLVSLTAMIVAYYIIAGHFNIKRFKIFIGAIVTSGALISFWTALRIFDVNIFSEKIKQIVPINVVGSVTGLGVFLAMLVPVMIMIIFEINGQDKMKKWLKYFLNVILTLVLVSNLLVIFSFYDFSPWLALLIGTGFFLIYILSRVVTPARNVMWIPAVIFIGILTMLMLPKINLIKNPEIQMPIKIMDSFDRNFSWDIAKNTVKENPLLGVGPSGYGYAFSLHKSSDFNLSELYSLRFYQGRGIILEALPTIGILGVVAMLLLILSFISVTMYLLSREKEKNKIYSLGMVSASFVLLSSLLIYRLEGINIIMMALIGTLAMAISINESESELEKKYIKLSLRSSPKYALSLAFVFMLVSVGAIFSFIFIGRIFVADIYAGAAVRGGNVSEDGSIKNLLKAVELNNKEGKYYIRIGQEYMYLANKEGLKDKDANVDEIRKDVNNSIVAAKSGQALMAKDAQATEFLAQIYEAASVFDSQYLQVETDTYNDALKLEPNNPGFYLKLADVKLRMAGASKDKDEKKKAVDEAKDLISKAIEKKDNLPVAYYNLASVEELSGDLDGAIYNTGKAVKLSSNGQSGYLFNLGRLYQARGKDEDLKYAESIFLTILKANENEINTHFNLGLLYEKTSRSSEARKEYEKVLGLIPADMKGAEEAIAQIKKMLDNLDRGIANTPENLSASSSPAADTTEPTDANSLSSPDITPAEDNILDNKPQE